MQARAPADGLEEIRHAVGIEAGGREEAHADAIGLGFVGAREIDLLLHGRALRHGDAAERGVTRAGGGADQDGGENGRHRRDALPALRAHAARDVTLRDVRDLVRQHAGELRFVARGEHQAVVHADEAAGQREGIDGVVAHEEELETLRRIARGLRDDARAERLQIFRGLGVFDDLAFVAQLAHDLQADVVLVVERQRGGGRAADVGQVVAGALRERGAAAATSDAEGDLPAGSSGPVSHEGGHRGFGPRRPGRVSAPRPRAYQRRNPPAASARRAPA